MSDRDFNSQSSMQQARLDFTRAHTKSFWNSIFNWIRNKDNELLPFDQVRQYMPMRSQHYAGLQQIETEKIIGSVSRYLDFDRAFLPRQTHTRSRWESIDRAYFQDIILPPIEVYRIGEAYFVKDGNHRVSVARERGQAYMDAYVTDFDSPAKLDEHTNLENLILEHEYVVFLQATGLDKYYPDESFKFSIPGQYEKMLQHISVHRWFMGEKLNRPVTDEEAIRGWYRDVYHPVIMNIRKHNIMAEFPHRTETDLYLWIIEHRWYLAEELHRRVSIESATLNFTRKFSHSRPLRHTRQILKWIKRKLFGAQD